MEHTADIGIVAHGKGLEEAFASAATGLFSLITDL
ncbi:MAG TPA: archease, partial [Dehalococcoidia bacterium]|nr:archease [Dehalococcoidia bacterium]